MDDLDFMFTRLKKVEMIAYVCNKPSLLDDLFKTALEIEHKYSWRSAWLLWSCLPYNDDRVVQKLKRIIEILPKSSESLQRELLKIISFIEIPQEFLAEILDLSISIWLDTAKTPGVRYNSFRIMHKIAKQNKELSKEIAIYCNDIYLESLSGGVRHSVKRIIKTLK